MVELKVTPMGKPRMTRSDRWNERDCVMKYRKYKDELRAEAARTGYQVGDAIRVSFLIPMPASWSKIKRRHTIGEPHKAKPDIDNLVKAFLDALLPNNDAQVWWIEARKHWSENGTILVTNLEED